MAVMGFRLAQRANGVSELHGHVARGMFSRLWPGFDEPEVPIGYITNGVHAPTWVAPEVFDLAEREIGPDLTQNPTDASGWEAIKRGLRRRHLGGPAAAARPAGRRRPQAGPRSPGCSAARATPSWAGSTRCSTPTS